MVHPNAKPNVAHNALKKLEKNWKLKLLLLKTLMNLNRWLSLLKFMNYMKVFIKTTVKMSWEEVLKYKEIPFCPKCLKKNQFNIIKPNVVLYCEMIDESVVEKSY